MFLNEYYDFKNFPTRISFIKLNAHVIRNKACFKINK